LKVSGKQNKKKIIQQKKNLQNKTNKNQKNQAEDRVAGYLASLLNILLLFNNKRIIVPKNCLVL